MLKGTKIEWLKDVLLPLLITITGVYLGLLINQWQAAQSNISLLNRIRTEIREEVKQNLTFLQNNYAYHEKMRNYLLILPNVSTDSAKKIRSNFQGLRIDFFQKNAYQSANNSGSFKIFPFEEYSKINKLYIQQEAMEVIGQMYLKEFLKIIISKDTSEEEYATFLSVFFADTNQNEKTLISDYKKWLEETKN
ncbi:MAG: hypothetical protein H7Y04_15370 [Verrucomicrobia bacterium]|nr:hypothetical protein [Cytophagales bacterium]